MTADRPDRFILKKLRLQLKDIIDEIESHLSTDPVNSDPAVNSEVGTAPEPETNEEQEDGN
jgi:hypothetical protein